MIRAQHYELRLHVADWSEKAEVSGPNSYARPSGEPDLYARATLIGVALSACAHAAQTVPPYRDDPVAGREFAERARGACLERTGRLPPRPFATDGCSAFARSRADERLARCVAERGHPALADLMHFGVRVGGVGWLPLPWRFGWDWPDDGNPR